MTADWGRATGPLLLFGPLPMLFLARRLFSVTEKVREAFLLRARAGS